MVGWIVFFIFAAMGILFWMGKGGWLIAGYNTASAEDKKRYDEKKLNRVMAKGWTIVTVGLLFLNLMEEKQSPLCMVIFLICVFAGVGYILLMSNTVCYAETEGMSEAEIEKIAREKRNGKRFSVLILVILAVLTGIPMFASSVQTEFTEDKIRLSGFLVPGYTFKQEEILSVSYEEGLNLGRRVNGNGSVRIQAGQFRNERFGNYRLYSYNSCKEYVVIDTEGKTIVVNDKTPEKTKELYEKIKIFSER